ncbi:hypothetical protein [Microbacterium sediminis]|uniref:Uncharacterized protein n=1 Tax=Microbacterium sediminis TaxID=904291 RepID=A0A1B9N8B0_9MICO|nr:hypothetical protein [Microbacterium sediminis]OCG72842.1 hypothetical protein A7J15_10075 [Microbacterium sediminis]QBR73480.1 hypothetical protein E3O41_02925 [Microbacterium sediminis]
MTRSPEPADSARKNPGRATRYASLDEAFERHGTPAANQELIRRIVDGIDAAGFVGFSTHFRIERRGGSPALEVHPGYTNGFRTEQEIVRRLGETVERWPSRRFHGAWGVTHPVARPAAPAPAPRAPRARRSSEPEAPPKVCPTCFMVLPMSGVCQNCDG